MESASCLVFAHTDIVPHRIEVILVCKYSIVKLKLAGGIVEIMRATSVQIIFFDRTEKKGVPTCMESSHNRLFNTFIHSSNKNHSSTLNFLNFWGLSNFIPPVKIRASTLNFLNFWGLSNIIFIHPARENQSLNPQLSQLLWNIQYNFYSSLP